MSSSSENVEIDARGGGIPRGRGQPSLRYRGRSSDPPPPEPVSPSTSLDTDPSEDSTDSDYVPESIPEPTMGYPEGEGENSPNSLSELGLRDHSDPGPEGSRHGHVGRTPTEPSVSRPPVQSQRVNASMVGSEGPDRLRMDGRHMPRYRPSRSPSRSPSVTSRRQYPVLEAQPEDPRRERTRNRPSCSDQDGRGPRVARVRNDAGDSVVRELREIIGRMRDRRQSQERQDRPPSPPDFLKMVMMMQNIGTQKFLGDKGPVEADSWLKHIERNFNATRCPEDFKSDVAMHYLLRDACNWWEGVRTQYGGELITWPVFRKEFERKYFPPEARDRMEAQFQTLVQGQRSVRDYEAEFTRLRQYAHYGVGDEPVVIRRFLRGLRPQLMSRLVVNQYYSLFELVERAVDVEEGIRIEQAAEDRVVQRYREQRPGPRDQVARTNNWAPGRGRGPSQGQTFGRGQGHGRGQAPGRTLDRGTAGRGTPAMDQLPVCFKCGGRGHFARACPNEGQTSRPVPTTVVCFTCNQAGHYASSCPVTHPTGPTNPRVGLRAMEWEVEPSAKRPAIEGRVYSLDKPEPSLPYRGPVTGK